MRWLTIPTLVLTVLASCASGSAGTTAQTSLTVTYWKAGVGTGGGRVTWTLRCDPARGTLPRPGIACRRLAVGGPRLFAPVPTDMACTEIYGGPQVARVVGVVQGKRIWAKFSREDGCQIARWSRVSPWLLPPGGVT